MRRLSQGLLFIGLSLGLHFALLALFQPFTTPAARQERSIGGVALHVGSLASMSRAAAPPPQSARPVPADAVPVTAARPVAREDVVSALRAPDPVLPSRPERPHITEAAPLEEAVKAPPPPVPAQKELAPPRTDMAHETPAPAETRSIAAAAGGRIADPSGAADRMSGSGGVRATSGGSDAISDYRGRVRDRLVRNKHYPAMAQRFNIQGVVTFTFSLTRDGAVSDLRITQSSGHAMLDKAAIRTVELSAPFERFPPEFTAERMEFHFPMTFSLD